MRRLRAWLLRFARRFSKQRGDSELLEELESHLAMHVEDDSRTRPTFGFPLLFRAMTSRQTIALTNTTSQSRS
jgi:hypothetical protein